MPVLRAVEERVEHALGAAGNVAASLAALGAQVALAAVVGADDAGRRIAELAGAARLDVDSLVTDPDRRTGVFSRIVLHGATGAGHHQIRVDREVGAAPSAAVRASLEQAVDARLDGADAVVLADYDETARRLGVLAPDLAGALVERARRRGIPVVATSRRHPEQFAGAEHLFVNREEARRLGLPAEQGAGALARRLAAEGRHGLVTITLGGEGAVTGTADGVHEIPALPVRVVDPCGAGDALLAATTLARLAGADPDEATRLGVHAAALAVGFVGTRPVTAPELVNLVRFGGAGAGKLHDPESLGRILDGLRGSHRIVFTNGFFDLFHSGHVELLRQARALGDLLVVALNSDRSTRENKGEGRPVLGERERVEIISSLEFVDYVTVFDELTPINVIRRLRPHLIVKGGSYRPEEVVGKDLVESRGGRVVVIPYAGRVTTEKLIRSIKAASDGTRPE
ncbi:MAG: bifunctional heptose 7-phosphate kinase/heptose 1-phosphate adenyltransferase [Acidobacteria bacterium]|nr:MAG: bifunctional heptose 7-phosphate kinase/heptose 1-phosphate adenyltransferase [Acidobacteriota bacterium]